MFIDKQTISPPLPVTTPKHLQKQHLTPLKPTTDIFSDDDSDDNNVLNEKVPDKTKLRAMQKSSSIISKQKTKMHRMTCPASI